MEEQEGENLDGSSIKPVSSLRSHFEQMTKPTLNVTTAPPRPISPKPKIQGSGALLDTRTAGGTNDLRSVQSLVSDTPLSLVKPLGSFRQVSEPISIFQSSGSPSVIIEPPTSPPRTLNLNLTLASPSALLSAEASRSPSKPRASSPRHYKIPDILSNQEPEPKKTPKSPAIQPPEPPPPRRSGEFRRDGTSKAPVGQAPPVNRAEKPKIIVKNDLLGRDLDGFGPTSTNQYSVIERASPFNTPPSGNSSPTFETEHPFAVPPASIGINQPARSRTPVLYFDPPPIHHSIQNLRRDNDIQGKPRAAQSSQATVESREQRPALPARPSSNMSSPSSARNSMDAHRPFTHSNASFETLRSSKNGATPVRSVESDSGLPTLPKRNFSSPTSQMQIPPRPHGRSMTIDQTNHRTQTEANDSGNMLSMKPEIFELGSSINLKNGSLGFQSYDNAEYPDTSFSNRRPPYADQGPAEILTHDSRIFDVCGGYVCSTGHQTRVWSLRDGEQVMNVPHGETTKIVSLAFKPTSSPSEEGSQLWLGTKNGEIIEVNVASESQVAVNYNAHNRKEIIKIYRHIDEMWTLDESGTLHIWAKQGAGNVNLGDPSATRRVPKGHTFSLLVMDDLWYATGNEICVFKPSVDPRVQFKRIQEPLQYKGTGEVTSGAIINGQEDRVYLGHADGKVSIYSSQDYSCFGIVNVSMYKIYSLAGAGDYLWAAYSTGDIYVYDTTSMPWVVKKDWRAHANPVISILTDRSSFWSLDRLQVISLGADNALKIWDGLLREDWLETKFQAQDERFCHLEQIKALIMTWNAGASTPRSLGYGAQDMNFIPNLLRESEMPDILVFGFQELVDLEGGKATAKSIFTKSKKKDPSEHEQMSRQYKEWSDYIIRCLDDTMPRNEIYHMLQSDNLVGLFTCVLIRARLRDRIKGVSVAKVKRGFGGRTGNKGALILRFMVDNTSLCFINCHLAAGQNQTKDRNFDISSILDSTLLPVEKSYGVRLDSYIGGGDGTMILDHEICILNGDLNYRIDTMPRNTIIDALKKGEIGRLLDRDQLLASRRKRPGFRLRAFHEMPITFAPTYKYDVGTDNYDTSEKKRTPAWCDRILFRGRDRERLKQLDYRRHEVRVSDHRPVSALFQITVKKISPEKRNIVWEECRRAFEEFKRNVGNSARLDFLQNMCGLDSESSQKLLEQRNREYR